MGRSVKEGKNIQYFPVRVGDSGLMVLPPPHRFLFGEVTVDRVLVIEQKVKIKKKLKLLYNSVTNSQWKNILSA